MCKNITVFVDLNRTGSKGHITFFPDEEYDGWNVFYRKHDTIFLINYGLNIVYFNTSELNITEV